jgi:hypothetical protein
MSYLRKKSVGKVNFPLRAKDVFQAAVKPFQWQIPDQGSKGFNFCVRVIDPELVDSTARGECCLAVF